MKSIYKNLGGTVNMPVFTERPLLYMHKSGINNLVLPKGYEDYYEAVNTMLSKLQNKNDVCYITIDEKRVKPNTTHRRGGIHVDYNWFENLYAHGSDGAGRHGHKAYIAPNTQQGGHSGGRGSHTDGREVGYGKQEGGHSGSRGTHSSFEEFNKNGGILMASNYAGCRVFRGDFYGTIADGGCCKSINVDGLENELIPAGDVYFLNPLCIHEGLVIDKEVNRSLIRINLHPDYKFN